MRNTKLTDRLNEMNADPTIVWVTQFWDNYVYDELDESCYDIFKFDSYAIFLNDFKIMEPIKMHEDELVITPSPNGSSSISSFVPPKIRRRLPTQLECVFCKNNQEKPELYRGHILKDPEGRVVCPVLRKYDCPVCHNNGGDNAHTVRYCPMNRAGLVQAKIVGTKKIKKKK